VLIRVRRYNLESSIFVGETARDFLFLPPAFLIPAGAPTMGVLWAKRRQQRHFRWHVPIAGR
jgi:hypothetical protein